jgi:hypothetical protein
MWCTNCLLRVGNKYFFQEDQTQGGDLGKRYFYNPICILVEPSPAQLVSLCGMITTPRRF